MERSTPALCRRRLATRVALAGLLWCCAQTRSAQAQIPRNFDNGCPSPNSNWGCDDNWDPNGAPNNDLPMGLFYDVTLDGSDSVVLDDFDPDGVVEIQTLTMLGDSILRSGATDLTVNGAVIMDDRCNYRGAFNPNARLTAGSLTMLEGDPTTGPRIYLTNDMQVFSIGEFLMDGSNYSGGPGSCTPPDLQTFGAAEMFINADFTVINAAKINYDSSQNMCLVGNWNNFSRFPALMDLVSSQITLAASCTPGPAPIPPGGGDGTPDTPLPPGPNTEATYEVAGMDLGAVLAFVDNYGVAQVVVEDNKVVTFQDQFDNDGLGDKPCTEALYANSLILGAGSTVRIDNCRVYYIQLIDNGADIEFTGCGQLVQLDLTGVPAMSSWHAAGLAAALLAVGGGVLKRRRGAARTN